MIKNILVVTGGCGFVGSNLIKTLIIKTKYKIISIDDYSSGSYKNHIKNKRITYLKANTKSINKILIKKKIEFTPYFILVNFREYTKVFYK